MSGLCLCPPNRPLGAEHVPTCPEFTGQVVSIYRNPDTDRPVAVPDEVVEAAEREYRAWKSHQRGRPWAQIAREEGYVDGMAASEAVKAYIAEGRAVVGAFRRQEVVATELSVLYAMRDGLWDEAVAGKPSAVMASLAVAKEIKSYYGLDQPDAEDAATQTVVVPSEDYIAQLEAAHLAAVTDTAESAQAG